MRTCAHKDGGAHEPAVSPVLPDVITSNVKSITKVSCSPLGMVTDYELGDLPDWKSPVFLQMYVNYNEMYDDMLLFSSPRTSTGASVDDYMSCALGRCHCLHFLDGSKSQLKPCRFA